MQSILKLFRNRVASLAVLAVACLPVAAGAQVQAEPWQYTGVIYGYLPTLKGSTSFPSGGGGANVSVPSDKLLDSLNFVFMGSLGAHNGRWGMFTDVMYLDLGAGKSQSRDFSFGNIGIPAGTVANLDMDVKGWVWTAAGEYRVASGSGHHMDVLVGARYVDLKQTLNYQFSGNVGPLPLPGASGVSTAGFSVWDGIVGVKGRFALGDERKWSMLYYLDVGTGQSKQTLQGMLGVSYAFSWGELLTTWRYLDYRFKSNQAVQDLNLSGPMIGAVFRW